MGTWKPKVKLDPKTDTGYNENLNLQYVFSKFKQLKALFYLNFNTEID